MTQLKSSGGLAGIILIIFALVLGGCSSADPDPITSIPQVSSFAPAKNEYRLQQGDNLKVVVLGQEAISGDYAIDGSGAIDVSNVGPVAVAGLTVPEAETRLTEKIGGRGIVDQPQVSVLLDARRPVFVSGAVAQPGEYAYRAGMDVATAIATAGGYAGNANRSMVYVTKAGTSKETMHVQGTYPAIGPGDIVRIPNG